MHTLDSRPDFSPRIFPNHLNMLDHYLRAIVGNIGLTSAMREEVERYYETVGNILRNAPEGSILKSIDLKVYAHGSLLSDTALRAIHDGEVDLDIVIVFSLDHRHSAISPQAVQDEIYKLLKNDGRYKDIVEKKSRCIRLNYKKKFHIDLMPALPETFGQDNSYILVPHKLTETLFDWQNSAPLPLNEWFISQEKMYLSEGIIKLSRMDNTIDQAPFPVADRNRSNMKSCLLLLKRIRDHLLCEEDDCGKIARSMALQVLVGTHYRPQGSLIEDLYYLITQIKKATFDYQNLHVYNPIQEHLDKEDREDFAEKWRQDYAMYEKFKNWLASAEEKVAAVMVMPAAAVTEYSELLKELFHERAVREVMDTYGQNILKFHKEEKFNLNSAGIVTTSMAAKNDSFPVTNTKYFGGNRVPKAKHSYKGKRLNIVAQIQSMREFFPSFNSSYCHKNKTVKWVGDICPGEMSATYKIEIILNEFGSPEVRVLSHDVAGAPHLYPEKKLCLYHPKDNNSWDRGRVIAKTIVPWAAMWLKYWELFKATGHWYGDEYPHRL
jgi:hypothetical protein